MTETAPSNTLASKLGTPIAAAMLATIGFFILDMVRGFGGLSMTSDSDSILRLVEVRDLLNGQNWFDPTQYRMGFEGGFPMHWSRLVDAPIAFLILVFSALTGSQAMVETVAMFVWPLLLLFAATYLTARLAVQLAGAAAAFPAAIVCMFSLATTFQFDAGSLDHHNIQFVLTLAAVVFLIEARERTVMGFLAGAASALSICIGMEVALYVAVTCLAASVWFILKGKEAAPAVARFGLGFAGVCLLVFFGTIAPARWGVAACDAFSSAQLSIAIVGGVGLAAVVSMASNLPTVVSRLIAIGLLGVAVVGVLAAFFPQCLAAPYSEVDPRQKTLWLDSVTETAPIWKMLKDDPITTAGLFVTPMLSLLVCWRAVCRNDHAGQYALIGGILAAATLIAAMQVRGATFALGLSAAPLGAWIAGLWPAARANVNGARLKFVITCILSLNFTWSAAAEIVAPVNNLKEAPKTKEQTEKDNCNSPQALAPLNGLPQTTLFNPLNSGAATLLYTNQRVLAGVYHRNEGNLLTYQISLATPEEAGKLLRANGIGAVFICEPADELSGITKEHPEGFYAHLRRGDVPDWLVPVPDGANGPLRIWRVKS